MDVHPEPSADATPFNDPTQVELAAGEKGIVTFTPERSGTTFYLASLAVSKFAQSTYEASADDVPFFGQAPAPPTDPDDMGVTFLPAKEFTDRLTVTIRNVGTSTRTYTIQPVGWEED